MSAEDRSELEHRREQERLALDGKRYERVRPLWLVRLEGRRGRGSAPSSHAAVGIGRLRAAVRGGEALWGGTGAPRTRVGRAGGVPAAVQLRHAFPDGLRRFPVPAPL